MAWWEKIHKMSSHNRQYIHSLSDQTDEQRYTMLHKKVATRHCKNKLLLNHSSQQTVFYKINGRRCYGSPIWGQNSCNTCVMQTNTNYWNEEGKQLKFKNIPNNALCYKCKDLQLEHKNYNVFQPFFIGHLHEVYLNICLKHRL